MSIKKILVTGSSGTIGTRLCEKLIEKGFEVIGADWVPNKWNKQIDKLTINVDLRKQPDVFNKLPKDIDLVIHLAANARVYNLVMEPTLARDNFETLFNVLEFARKNNITKFIFSSSREVYGNSGTTTHKEDEAYVQNCESPYTATKIGAEALIHSYQQCYGIDIIIVRFSNVYGMYDDSDRLIPLFIQLCNEERDLVVFGEEKFLDCTYIDDTVAGVMLCIEKFDKAKNEVYNIAYGQGSSILRIAELMRQLLGVNNKIIIKENRIGEVVKYVADISKARDKLGYEPQVPINEGIKKSIKWYKDHLYL
ncbi:SDR family NAD(P)-dependent oxidoreductase [Patescibacteria group bacterium]|nr:SDR family NAD(P)-dependent oxidoreductase [Patescibacteria group bacterium]MBU1682749.1 SDR family NAD(P)-dependent oxidoreductase [Patescibacteria group bacterium]